MIALVTSLAAAQEGVDAHQLQLIPQRGDVHSAFTVRTATGMNRGDLYGGMIFEYAHALLKLHQTFADESEGEVVGLGRTGVLNLGAGYAVHDRIRFELAMPVVPFSTGLEGSNGFSVGDLRLGGALAVLSPKDDHGFGLEVAPYLDIPTGNQDIFLGDSGIAGGGEIAVGYRAGDWTVGGSGGMEFQPSVDLRNLDGADQVRLGVSGGYAPLPVWGLTTEVVAGVPLSKNAVAGTGMPAEVRLGSRNRIVDGFTLVAGGAAGISGGVGAANWRVFVGGTYGPQRAPEVVVATPPPLPADLHLVASFGNEPVNGAELTWTLDATSATETVTKDGISAANLAPGTSLSARASFGGCMEGTFSTSLVSGRNDLSVDMRWEAGAVNWAALDADRKKVAGATVTWKDGFPCTAEPFVLTDGSGTQAIGVGTWTAVVAKDGYAPVEVTFTVPPGAVEQVVTLTPAAP